MTPYDGMQTSPPPSTPYQAIGEYAGVRGLVDRFYDLMDADPRFAALRALHGEDLGPMRESLAGFLCGWLGGPRDWFEQRSGACIMSMHARVPVSDETASQWVEAMARAISDCGIEAGAASAINQALSRMARGMAA